MIFALDKLYERSKSSVKELFTQGLTPHEIALSIAVASYWGLFPFPGIATPVLTFICWKWKLNLPIAMFLAYAIIPLQISLFIPYVYGGEWIFGAEHLPINFESFRDELSSGLVQTLLQRGTQIGHGIVGWLVFTLPAFVLIYVVLKWIFTLRTRSN